MTDDAIHVRVASSLKKQILELVETGEYRDMTDFVTKAIRNQLEYEPIDNYGRFREMLLNLLEDEEEETLREPILEIFEESLKEGMTEYIKYEYLDDLQKQIDDLQPIVEWAKKKMEEDNQ